MEGEMVPQVTGEHKPSSSLPWQSLPAPGAGKDPKGQGIWLPLNVLTATVSTESQKTSVSPGVFYDALHCGTHVRVLQCQQPIVESSPRTQMDPRPAPDARIPKPQWLLGSGIWGWRVKGFACGPPFPPESLASLNQNLKGKRFHWWQYPSL